MDTNPNPEVTPEQDLLNALDDAPEGEVVEEAQTDDEQPTDEAPAEDSEQEQPAADEEEVELDGEKLKLPKKVAEAVMRQQDYTRKTQEVAQQRRTVEDKAQYLDAREQILQSTFQEAAELQATQKQLEQYAALDWNALIADDPQQAMRLSMARQELQSKLNEKQRAVQTLIANAEAARNQHLAKQQELGRVELQRRVGALSDTDRKRTYEQGVALGYTDQELSTIADPRIMHALYKAAQWDALQAAKPQAMKKGAQAPAAVKPSAPTPVRQRQNQAALDRLKTTGRASELINFL
jgi:hypothetical protein